MQQIEIRSRRNVSQTLLLDPERLAQILSRYLNARMFRTSIAVDGQGPLYDATEHQ